MDDREEEDKVQFGSLHDFLTKNRNPAKIISSVTRVETSEGQSLKGLAGVFEVTITADTVQWENGSTSTIDMIDSIVFRKSKGTEADEPSSI